ncbi:hypothetical protein ALC57_18720 [Trachymyrmex cornetzi]|uniref:Uncharacterized protein n=1 Tax=Trachymyrmex cornetzi TaxID=471704 RepID=A0A151IR93_9HYME|nr:hypothetical protein ALC57_18720 [Trachymyrmex cornetzi]
MLLPTAIKALNSKNPDLSKKQTVKRRKVESVEEKLLKQQERQSFILHVDVSKSSNIHTYTFPSVILIYVIFKQTEANLEDAVINAQSNQGSIKPFIPVVGSIRSPKRYYSIIGRARYEVPSVIEALELAFKIYIVYDFSYPKATLNVWLLIQKILFKVSLPGEKLSIQVNKVLSFIENELGTTID